MRPNPTLVRVLSENMTRDDRIEVMLSHGHTAQDAIEKGLEVSKFTTVGCVGDDVCCIFGVTEKSLLTRHGIPWMLTTDKMELHKRILMEGSIDVVNEMKRHFNHLENYVYVENKRSVRWLKWLGFEFDEPEPHGKYQQPFMRFYWEKVYV